MVFKGLLSLPVGLSRFLWIGIHTTTVRFASFILALLDAGANRFKAHPTSCAFVHYATAR
jgi:hypothetical protein